MHLNTVWIWNPTLWNLDLLKVGFQMVWFSNGRALAIVPTIRNPDIFVQITNYFWRYCKDTEPLYHYFMYSLVSKQWPFVQISNGWASGFQIPFRPFATQPVFWSFEIQTSPDFRSPLFQNSDISWPEYYTSPVLRSSL